MVKRIVKSVILSFSLYCDMYRQNEEEFNGVKTEISWKYIHLLMYQDVWK